jgi:hypothetical protein
LIQRHSLIQRRSLILHDSLIHDHSTRLGKLGCLKTACASFVGLFLC